MRFLHTSDWHLGRLFHGVHLTEDQAYVLEQLVVLAKEAKVDAVLVAGDIYDRAVPPAEAVELLNEVLQKLVLECALPTVLIAGNHDSPERLGFGSALLARQGLHVAGPLQAQQPALILEDSAGPVHILSLPYAEPAAVRYALGEEAADHDAALRCQIAAALAKVPQGARKVAVAHAFVAGGAASESERPLSVGGSGMVGADAFSAFDYTALGHLHGCQQSGNKVRYSGSLLKYSFQEAAQTKGVQLVDLAADGAVTVETVRLTPRRDVVCWQGSFQELLARPKCSDYLMVTLTDDAPVLDAKGRLQQQHPEILHLEYARLQKLKEQQGVQDHRRLGPEELFACFFREVAGREWKREEEALFAALVEEEYRRQREVGL